MNRLKVNKWVWLHYNQLNPEHDIFQQVTDYEAVLFIWDEAYFEDLFFSKQRLYFIWQCLTDFQHRNLHVIKGDTNAVLEALYKHNPHTQVFTPVNPVLNDQCWSFVEQLKQNQFIVFDQSIPFGFFKFWKEAKKQLLGVKK